MTPDQFKSVKSKALQCSRRGEVSIGTDGFLKILDDLESAETKLAEAKLIIGVLDDMIDDAKEICRTDSWGTGGRRRVDAEAIERALAHRDVTA